MTFDATDADWIAFDAALQANLTALGVQIDADRRQLMYAHYQLVVEANRQFNLTRITSPEDAAVKHYADSLSPLATKWFDPAAALSVLDVGTGAGFPAVPLAIACPQWSITAIDGTGKKVRFVAESAAAIGLSNVTAVHARAADLVQQGGDRFDLILVRAVGQIADVLVETARLLKRGGAILFYKTARLEESEESAAGQAARRRRLICGTYHLQLHLNAELLPRQLLRYRS